MVEQGKRAIMIDRARGEGVKPVDKKTDIRCVIYDCDGVLIDSLEANRRFYDHFRTTLGRSPLTKEELEYVHTHTVHEAIRHIFSNDRVLIEQALGLFSKFDPEESIRHLKLEPNLVPTLKILKERGIIRAVSTSRSTNMKPILERFGLEPYFDLVITALDVQNPKPHPESIEKIIRAFSLEKDEAVFLGDSEIDRQAAGLAGVRFIAYKNKRISADAFIDDHLAILNLLSGGENLGEKS
jgi:phosphoglycolate phosphatase